MIAVALQDELRNILLHSLACLGGVDGLAEYNNGIYNLLVSLYPPTIATATATSHPTSSTTSHRTRAQPTYPPRLHQTNSITIRARHNRRPPRLNREVPALNNEACVANESRVLQGFVLLVSDLERQIRRCNHASQPPHQRE